MLTEYYIVLRCSVNSRFQNNRFLLTSICEATCFKSEIRVIYYQILYLLLELYQITNTELIFFQVSLLKDNTWLNTLFIKTICPVAKNSAANCSKSQKQQNLWTTYHTFSKFAGTFQQLLSTDFCHWIKIKAKVAIWQPIKFLPNMRRGMDLKNMNWWAKLFCKLPKSKMSKLSLNVPPFGFVPVSKNWTEIF